MSTLMEIEDAIEKLSPSQVEELMRFLAEKAAQRSGADPFEAMVAAFAGPEDATGRRAEEILYGKETEA